MLIYVHLYILSNTVIYDIDFFCIYVEIKLIKLRAIRASQRLAYQKLYFISKWKLYTSFILLMLGDIPWNLLRCARAIICTENIMVSILILHKIVTWSRGIGT